MSGIALEGVLLDDYERLKEFTEDILNSLPNLYYLLDEQGKVIKWNQKSCEFSGYTHEEHAGLSIFQLFDEEHATAVAHEIKRVFSEGYASVEAKLKPRTGISSPTCSVAKRSSSTVRVIFHGLAWISQIARPWR